MSDTGAGPDRPLPTDPTAAELEVYQAAGNPPTHDLAFERWLMERAAQGRCCVSLYTWQRPVVVLGHGQPVSDVDLEWCRRRPLPVLRRITGGTGVIHMNDLAVSLALPREHPWARGLLDLYRLFLDALMPALEAVGSPVSRLDEPRRAGRQRSPICFEDQLADTLTVDGRKVVGCAQSRRARAVLIHAAVLLDLDVELYAKVFRVAPSRVAGALAPIANGVSCDELACHVVHHLADALALPAAAHERPTLSAQLLATCAEERWAPVAE